MTRAPLVAKRSSLANSGKPRNSQNFLKAGSLPAAEPQKTQMLFKRPFPAGSDCEWRGAPIGRLRAYVTVRLVYRLFARYIAFTARQKAAGRLSCGTQDSIWLGQANGERHGQVVQYR